MGWAIWIPLTAVGFWALHHLLLFAERRGWLYYKHRKSSVSGGIFLQLESIVSPGARHQLEAREEQVAGDEESGEP